MSHLLGFGYSWHVNGDVAKILYVWHSLCSTQMPDFMTNNHKNMLLCAETICGIVIYTVNPTERNQFKSFYNFNKFSQLPAAAHGVCLKVLSCNNCIWMYQSYIAGRTDRGQVPRRPTPGMMTRSMSLKIRCQSSPSSGHVSGTRACMYPGWTSGKTRRLRMFSR